MAPLNCRARWLIVVLIAPLFVTTARAGQGSPTGVSGAASDSQASDLPPALQSAYRAAYRFTQNPPRDPHLRVSCAVRLGGHYVSFVGLEDAPSFIVAFTKRRLADPSQDIWLKQKYILKRGLPHFIGRDPRRDTATMNWAYVFDRNGDGRVDYLAFLESPMPVWPEGEKGEKPRILGNILGKDYKMAFRNVKMVFWHLADQNFDGRADAVMVPMRDKKTGWIDSLLAAWDANFDGHYGHCSYFEGLLPGRPHACMTSASRYYAPGKELMGLRKVPPGPGLFEQINKAAAECHFGPKAFYRWVDDVPHRQSPAE